MREVWPVIVRAQEIVLSHCRFLAVLLVVVVTFAAVIVCFSHRQIVRAKSDGDAKARCEYEAMTNRLATAQRDFEERQVPALKAQSDENLHRRCAEFYASLMKRKSVLPTLFNKLKNSVEVDYGLSCLDVGVEYPVENDLGFQSFSVERREDEEEYFAVLHFANVLKNIRVTLEIFDEHYLCNGRVVKDVNAQDKRYMKIAGNFLLSVWMAKQELKTQGNGIVANVKREAYARGVKHFGQAAGEGLGKEMFGGAEGLTFVDACAFSDSLVRITVPKYFRVRVEAK